MAASVTGLKVPGHRRSGLRNSHRVPVPTLHEMRVKRHIALVDVIKHAAHD